MAEKLRDRHLAGADLTEAKQPFHKYLESYLDNAEGTIRINTLNAYRSLAKTHIYPKIGHIPLGSLTCRILDDFYKKLSISGNTKTGKGLSARTVRHIHIVIHKSLSRAVAHGILTHNPATHTTRPPVGQSSRTTLDNENLRKLSSLIGTIDDKVLAAALALGLYTGMRRGEVLGLTWEDVDFEGLSGAGLIVINKTLHEDRKGGVHYGEPKTKGSRRTITMTESLKDFLRDYKEWHKPTIESIGLEWTEKTPVITSYYGKAMRPDVLTNRVVKFRAKHDMPNGFSFHSLRHTHASYALSGGIPIQALSARLGHSSIVQTVDTYGHLVEGVDEATTKVFEDTLKKVLDDEQPIDTPSQ